jgi:hypothetical protein
VAKPILDDELRRPTGSYFERILGKRLSEIRAKNASPFTRPPAAPPIDMRQRVASVEHEQKHITRGTFLTLLQRAASQDISGNARTLYHVAKRRFAEGDATDFLSKGDLRKFVQTCGDMGLSGCATFRMLASLVERESVGF